LTDPAQHCVDDLLYDRHHCLSVNSQFHEQANSCPFCCAQLITGAHARLCDNADKTGGSNHLKHIPRRGHGTLKKPANVRVFSYKDVSDFKRR
jgi:hypothetical protein